MHVGLETPRSSASFIILYGDIHSYAVHIYSVVDCTFGDMNELHYLRTRWAHPREEVLCVDYFGLGWSVRSGCTSQPPPIDGGLFFHVVQLLGVHFK